MILTELAVFLEGFGDVGTRAAGSLALGRLTDDPSDPAPITALLETVPEIPEYNFGQVGIDRERPRIQITTRSAPADYSTARARIELVFKHLSRIQAQTLSGTFYWEAEPLSSPYQLKIDEQDRVHFVFNMRFMRDVP